MSRVSEDGKRRIAAALAARRNDPEIEARRIAAIRASNAARKGKTTPEQRERRAASAKAAWDRRRAEGRDKISYTPEQKAKRYARLKACLADPAIEAKRQQRAAAGVRRVRHTKPFMDAVKAGLRAHYADPVNRAKASARSRKAAADPKLRAKLSAEKRRWMAENPQHLRRMIKAQNTPEAKRKMAAHRKAAQDMARGFHIPEHRKAEYKFLTATKKMRAAEAGRHMGLMP